MSIVQTEAVLLKKFKYGDTSIIANFFSKDFGKFTAIVKGARNLKSGKSAVYQSMNRMTLMFNKKENRDLQIINKADLIDTYEGIKINLDKINTAFRILELVNRLYIEYDKHPETFHLVTDVLKNIEQAEINFMNYLIFFQLKISEYTGFSLFGKKNSLISDAVHDFKDETFVSNASFKYLDSYMDILFEINFSKLDRVSQFKLNEKEADIISDFLDDYLLQDNYLNELKTTRIINQMKRFN
jgi:DNA repair protein RecO